MKWASSLKGTKLTQEETDNVNIPTSSKNIELYFKALPLRVGGVRDQAKDLYTCIYA